MVPIKIIAVLTFCLIIPYESGAEVRERIDDFGIHWVGPIRKCPYEDDLVLDKCTAKIVKDLTPLVGDGIQELGLEPLDPLVFEELPYEKDFGPIKIIIGSNNVRLHNLPKYKNLKFHVDTNKRIMRFVYENPKISLDANYKLGGNAFFFPLTGTGPVNLDIFGMKVQGHMNFYKTENEDGEKVIQLKDTVIDTMTIKGMRLQIRGLLDGNPLFSAVAHFFANRYGPQIFEIARPDLSIITGDIITNRLLNPVLNKLPYIAGYVPDL